MTMAAHDSAALVQRFIRLPLAQRQAFLEKLASKGMSLAQLPIPGGCVEGETAPMSYAQERQWFLWQFDPAGAAYNIPLVLRLRGDVQLAALRRSLAALVERQASLRTVFIEQADGERLQRVCPPFAPELMERTVEAGQLAAMIESETQQPFDLRQGPLLRCAVFKVDAQERVLVLTLHHAIADGWSLQVLLKELLAGYAAFSQGHEPALAPLPIQYRDYALWQRCWMEAGEQARQLGYWTRQLGGEQPLLELPLDRPRPMVQSLRGARLQVALPTTLADGLRQLAQREQATLFMVLLASFQVLLHRYSNQSDIRVGVPVANRNRVETEGLVGFFVNTQVLKAQIDPQASFQALLQQVRSAALEAQAHQELPFEQLVQALQPSRSLSHSPLFQVMFNHQGGAAQGGEALALPGLSIEGLEAQGQAAKFDLTLDTHEAGQALSATLTYATDLFDAATIETMAGHWLNLLHGIVEAPAQRVGQLPLLAAHEQQLMVEAWNATAVPFADDQCLHQLIEASAVRTPTAPALSVAGETLDYATLNRRANRLARRLRAAGVGPDVLVGIAVERGVELVVGLLAILKAGGAYVPMDPEYPAERLAHMVEDSGAQLVLTQAHLRGALALPAGVAALELQAGEDWLAEFDGDNLDNLAAPGNLAYVIYTSGSTGKPKGVGVRHDGVLNFLASMLKQPGIDAHDRVLSLTSLSFDIAGLELYGSLLAGACIVLVERATARDPQALLAAIEAERVSVVQATPSTWRMLLDSPQAASLAGCKALCGGEALAPDLAARLIERCGHVWNLYGPTETTIWSALHYLDAGSPQVLLGRPLDNTALLVLDADLQPVPVGVAGELYIGGAGLARGYHQRPGLTAERFLASPFADGERIYRTGDLARFDGQGRLEYIGRADHQVKIRGFRIELGEIEAQLLARAEVREAAVVARDTGLGTQLVGYLVPADAALVEAGEAQQALRETLRAALGEALPEFMVPAQLMLLARMPLTPNGKLDRKALPAPDASLAQARYQAPRSELECQLAQIWAEVLKLEKVGLADNFFELGGHSLLATQVISRVTQGLAIEVPLRTLFEHATLGAFAQAVGRVASKPVAAITRVARDQDLPLSFAQQRQWLLWQFAPDSTAYTIPAVLRLRGALDVAALERSFAALVERHESLRTTFRQTAEGPLQVIQDAVSVAMPVRALQGATEAQVEAQIKQLLQRPFDLATGPLLRVELLRLSEEEHVLVMTQHHIVSDAWSMQRLVEELVALYDAFSQGQAAQLPALPIQYLDYAVWQRQWLAEGEQARQLAYWTAKLGGEQPVLELPTDRPRPAAQSYRGARHALHLAPALADGLRQLAQREQVTLFMLLLASFQALLHRYSGQADIRVGVPIANRTRLETEGVVGFFVNTQVLKAEVDGQASFQALLQQVRNAALEAQAHQDLPFEQLVEALQPERSLSHSPLFQVMFNHQRVAAAMAAPHGLQVEALGWDSHSTQFDLSLNTFEGEQGLSASLVYATDLFDAVSIERLGAHWQQLLQGLVADVQAPLGQLTLLAPAEREQALHGWNATGRDYDLALSVPQRFEAQVAATPQAPALMFADQQLSYAELNARANRLARELVAQGATADALVGIAVERSVEMVVGLLAILKAGAAYVPLDPEYPRERLAYMIEDSGIDLLLTQAHLLAELPLGEGVRSLVLDQPDAWLAGHGDSNLGLVPAPQQLAYVIYTSGSTGKPKGAGNRHDALVNRLCWMQEAYGLTAADSVLQKTPFSFDVSVWEFFWPLITGARLVVAAPGAHRDPGQLIALIEAEQVSTLHFVPSMLQAFLQDPQVTRCTSLRRIVCSGEALPVDAQQQVLARLPWSGLYNLYGPTEAAIDVTHWTCREEGRDSVPIGVPIANLATYILDAELAPVPVGVAGELYLGGVGLARGYHRRPALTAERFVASPFGGERLYRTGDLARYRADGVIEYAGRIDHQVKIRGLRIELGEIEARLLEQPGIREAVVLAIDTPAGKQLAGYLVPEDAAVLQAPAQEQAQLAEQVRRQLRQALPEYMVPGPLMLLAQLPLSPNGKLDRKALPALEASSARPPFSPPVTELQCQVAAIWQAVLGCARVGLADSFFELGGHSLAVVNVVSRIQLELGLAPGPQALFQHPTLEAFVAHLEQSGKQVDTVKLNKLEALLDEMEEV